MSRVGRVVFPDWLDLAVAEKAALEHLGELTDNVPVGGIISMSFKPLRGPGREEVIPVVFVGNNDIRIVGEIGEARDTAMLREIDLIGFDLEHLPDEFFQTVYVEPRKKDLSS